MRWSRNAALNTCVEFGLVDLEQERGPGGKINRDTRGGSGEAGNDLEVAEWGAGGGISKSEASTAQPEGAGSASVAGKGAGAQAGAVEGVRSKVLDKAAGGTLRGSGKCPHGYVNWMVCRNEGGGCE